MAMALIICIVIFNFQKPWYLTALSLSFFQQYFEELNPLESLSVKDLNEILYNKSLELEPRGAKAPIRFVSNTLQHITLFLLINWWLYKLVSNLFEEL